MVRFSDIREHMEVVGSDGIHVGTVDHLDGDARLKLTRADSPDDEHHYVPLSAVARVDSKVHLNFTGAAALAMIGVPIAATALGSGSPPPIRDRAVAAAPARRGALLPWIVGIVGVILLLLLLRSYMAHRAEAPATTTAVVSPRTDGAAAPLPVGSVTLPDGTSISLAPDTLNYALQRYLASDEPTPGTFTFDTLTFDTGAAAIRAEDQPNVDALARILVAYPKATVRIVGYTDAVGPAPANARLGAQRAEAVVAALAAKGVDAKRMTAASGGETNPADTNATAQGKSENRRSELVVTAK